MLRVVVLILIAVCFASNNLHAYAVSPMTRNRAETLQALQSVSELIVLGTVIDLSPHYISRPDAATPHPAIVTDVTLRVSSVLKGRVEGEAVVFFVVGGCIEEDDI